MGGRPDCRSGFDELLAFEFTEPAAFGPVHHLTVACFFLQHPDGHTLDALAMWRRMISDPAAGGAHAQEALPAMHAAFYGPTRVREPGALPPAWWPAAWPLTVWDAFPSHGEVFDAAGHVERVQAWARAVGSALDASDPTRHA